MTKPLTSQHFRYDRHAEEWEDCISDPDKSKIALTWLEQKDTFDKWRDYPL